MLETRFKVAILLAVLFMTVLPVIGILKGTKPPPPEVATRVPHDGELQDSLADQTSAHIDPIPEKMIRIPAGPFIRGTGAGGYDERPEHTASLEAYWIDRHEVTNHHYQEFRAATGHRYAGPPSRYAKNMARLRGMNQPIVYVSWEDAAAYCRWKGKRLPTEAEWEKAMRGTDGRLWPWGNELDLTAANWGNQDGYPVAAPVGTFQRDVSPFGVVDGAGNVMEWVADWYEERAYHLPHPRNPAGPEHGVYRVMRGGVYTTRGKDLRITSRSKMVPTFRDETIGFRCAKSANGRGGQTASSVAGNSQEIKVVED
ncbi:MAG: formylglycine-generating enzyme family protein [Nitrospiraceae bacterium]